ncbi:MAG: hypothetical protein ACOCWC_05845 [Bacteroidota bacterium]
MKKILVLTILIGNVVLLFGQEYEGQKAFDKFALINSFVFQNFSLPFYDLKSNFSHPGFIVGGETNLNKKNNLLLNIGLAGYLNKEMGNGFYLQSQTIYRPKLFDYVHPLIKIGVGWHRSYHPVQSYEFIDGDWTKTVGGKSQLTIPIGIGVEYKKNAANKSLIPFLSYQMVPNLYYNKTIPISFYTFFETGIKLKFK